MSEGTAERIMKIEMRLKEAKERPSKEAHYSTKHSIEDITFLLNRVKEVEEENKVLRRALAEKV